ncbi:iron-containing alcohol dehydrogenase [Psychrobacillus sp. INOP01]|uniref:hydroxyacid-oxoacid transhydrogenase n=1 Tax=Psychrobacillus sp. INOP01 TaxID=2829187 RepID=UPI001BA85666|nr:hydroxyacid-oxoacid transhydrogenase [Psychrobacillus sp. INOP01]QUG42585.1 iron-containing alcohol dehydrogenase [Psychrobacillus sp. INOP01]
MKSIWEFLGPQQIIFGNEAVLEIPEVLKRFNYKSILVITDKGIASTPILEKVLAPLKNESFIVTVFDEAIPEPTLEAVVTAYEKLREQTSFDLIIGLGGGSSIDFAKIVSLLLKYGGSPRDYYDGKKLVPGEVIPIIAIPTTAGTGSEVTTVAVINDVELELKVGLTDNYLRPRIALIDPTLTLGLPPYVTACSGIDALAHAIEAYTAKPFYTFEQGERAVFQGAFPLTEPLALKAIDLIGGNLEIAVHQGSNIHARDNMLLGSLLAGISFSNSGTALAHAIAYPIGGKTKSPHGEIIGLLLPYVVKFNAKMNPDKTAQLYSLLVKGDENLILDEKIKALYNYLISLNESIGLPIKLSQIGIKQDELEGIAEKTLEIKRLARNNPRVLTKDNLVALLDEAF